jgi:hypothetical protein
MARVDPGTRRIYLADRSNAGIDIIDAETPGPLTACS